MADTRRDTRRDTEYDLVLVGATGFTGGLVAQYLARAAPDGLRWALAGRNHAKLAAARDRVAGRDARWADLPLLTLDVGDADSVGAVAASTSVVATTVGPYARHGEPLVAACARTGAGYVDLTGEPAFVDRMYARHDAAARASGARIVHACGFDSIPYDLGVLATVDRLAALEPGAPIAVEGVVRAGGSVSGGTLASALEAFADARGTAAAARERRRTEPAPAGRTVRAPTGVPARRDGLWLLPLPTLDPQIVARSARALPQYGPDFSYRHYVGFRHLPVAAGAVAGAGAVLGLAQLPPVRRLLTRRLPSGAGPGEQRRAAGWFTARFTARTPGHTVITEVAGGDPGYDATAIMFGEAALCLALDDLPTEGGQLTTAVAMGQHLIGRLTRAGIEFRQLR